MTHPFQFIDKQEPSISISQAAEELGLGQSTIYNYIKEGLLEAVDTFDGPKTVTVASIEKLKQRGIDQSTGTSLGQLAKELNVTRSRLLKTVEQAGITIPKVKHGNREQYNITTEVKEKVLEALMHQKEFPKTSFFYRKDNICLHQPFYSDLQEQEYRIIYEDGTWGIGTPAGICDFEIAKARYQLRPLYNVHSKLRNTTLQVTFQISLVNPKFFKFMDTLYVLCGIENLSFQYDQENLIVRARAGRYKLLKEELASRCIDLQPFMIDGEVKSSEAGMILTSTDIVVPVTLTKQQYEYCSSLASKKQMSCEEYLLNLVLENKD
ncbi:hypothetical protein ACQKMI_23015 [Lysinibacillus sp. NPDC097214]|uniref:helix-turn-helix domain-containing protein n=1 Tax=Lysinibacillus sp. NPDC097214 TaxID=3390584 RepID=UPI003D08D551